MDTTTPTTTNKPAKKSATKQPLEQVKTGRIIMHLVYRHRVGLLITSNVALIGYVITSAIN
jgi:hypothetical protein